MTNTSICQNLVKNPSFENYLQLSPTLGNINDCQFWTNPLATNPDFYHQDSPYFYTHAPVNIAGIQHPRTGKGYAGLIAYQKGDSWCEYLQGQLVQALEVNKVYEISFWVSPGELSSFFTDQLGVYFSSDSIFEPEEFAYTPTSRIQSKSTPKDYFYDQLDRWTRFTASYTARGGERFLIIGNLGGCDPKYAARENPITVGMNIENMAYLYLDDVRLIPHDFDTLASDSLNRGNSNEMPLDQEVVLANSDDVFLGETAEIMNERQLVRKYGLGVETQIMVLNYFIHFLKINPEFTFEIGVHIDDEYDEEWNLEVTQARAESIVTYLFRQGIPRERMTAKGYGSSVPMKSNDTFEGQEANRRISFKITARIPAKTE
ncbi:MAG: OmpA family protein [Salibacteraceae bacterium]